MLSQEGGLAQAEDLNGIRPAGVNHPSKLQFYLRAPCSKKLHLTRTTTDSPLAALRSFAADRFAAAISKKPALPQSANS